MTIAVRLIGGGVAAASLMLVGACAGSGDRSAVSPLAATSLGGEAKGGNGGGPGSSETPLITTVSDVGHVRSDGLGPYLDDVDGIHSGDIDGTQLLVNQTDGYDSTPARKFWINFNSPVAGSPALGEYLHGGSIRVLDDPSSPMDLAVGETGLFVTKVNTYADFDGNLYSVHCRFGIEGAPLAPVTRTSDTTWVLKTSATDWCALNWNHPAPNGKRYVKEEYGQYYLELEVTFERVVQ
jgi:hypothetical protein